MAKRYKKITQKKTKIRLSPENAEKILEQEFTDSKGNKFKNLFIFSFEPFFFKQTIKDKENEDGNNKSN